MAKKKMEEEKAKRREKKKKRKKRKRQGAEKITGIERWVYDPITGKKVKKMAKDIAVTQYTLTDSNKGDLDFASSDGINKGRSETLIATKQSAVAGLAHRQQAEKQQKRRSPQKNK